jgi:iron(III) transport system permease protein
LFLGVISATGATLLGGIVSYFSIKSKIRGSQTVEFIGSAAQAVPGTVLGLGMILAWIKPVGGITIYNTIWIIAAAYIAHYISLSIRTTSASFYQIHDSLEEAARMSGATWSETMRDIVFPMIRSGLIASWLLVFMPSLRELTISILLWSSGNETIGVSVFNLSEGGQSQYASAMGVVLIIIVFLGNLVIKKATRNKYGF